MSDISDELLCELLTLSNEINGVKETVSCVPKSDTLILSHLENGSTCEELVEPFQHLLKLSRHKPYSDVAYVQQRRPDIELDIRRNHTDLNLYDLDTFLRAIVPSQKHLIQIINDQCHVHPQFQVLVARLHLLNARCQRPICQGRILSETRFGNDSLSFPVAHPPFVYELESLLSARDSERLVETYLMHLMRYLSGDDSVENDSCLLCLTFDLYATDQTNLKKISSLLPRKYLSGVQKSRYVGPTVRHRY